MRRFSKAPSFISLLLKATPVGAAFAALAAKAASFVKLISAAFPDVTASETCSESNFAAEKVFLESADVKSTSSGKFSIPEFTT